MHFISVMKVLVRLEKIEISVSMTKGNHFDRGIRNLSGQEKDGLCQVNLGQEALDLPNLLKKDYV